jgi:hypothetical protein
MSEEKIFAELEAKTSELYSKQLAAATPAGAEAELGAAMKKAYGEEPKMAQVLGIGAAGSGTAQYALVDYSFVANVRCLWAYVGGAWRSRLLTDQQVEGIAKVVMEANRLDVWWSDGAINFVRCWKSF